MTTTPASDLLRPFLQPSQRGRPVDVTLTFHTTIGKDSKALGAFVEQAASTIRGMRSLTLAHAR